MNIFDESLTILKSKVQLRKLFQDTHVEDIQNIIKRLEAIHEEKQLEQLEQREQEVRKREALESIIGQLQQKGLSLEDLQGASTTEKTKVRKGKPRQRYRFQYHRADGTSVNWEGATTGRIPDEFNDYLRKTGKERKDCIVEEI